MSKRNQRKYLQWYPGVVLGADHVNRTYDIRYDDGDYEQDVKRRFVRVLPEGMGSE